MSTIKIPINGQAPANPEAGTVVIYSDGSNGGNLTTLNNQGTKVDLTKLGTGSFEVKELDIEISAAQLEAMSWEEGLDPLAGLEILPAPGEGKCHVLAFGGVFASYIPQGEAWRAEPYGMYRSLDIYYGTPGHTGEYNSETVVRIPLFRDPTSSWKNQEYDKQPDEKLYEWNGQESLNMDFALNSTVYQPLSVKAPDQVTYAKGVEAVNLNVGSPLGSGLVGTSYVNKAMYVATNGDIAKVAENTAGTIKLRAWYATVDMSDLVEAGRQLETPLPEFQNPFMQVTPRTVYNFSDIDFGDIVLQKPTFAEFDNSPASGVTPDAEDYATEFRAQRDTYLKTQNEWILTRALKADGFTWENGGQQLNDRATVSQQPRPQFFGGRQWYAIPALNGPDATAFGWPHRSDNFIKAREPEELPYPSQTGTRCLVAKIKEGTGDMIYDATSNRITGFTITNAGTGYLVGDSLEISDGSNGKGCAAAVSEVGAGGEILAIEITLNGLTYGGWNWDPATTTALVTSEGGANATVTPIFELGQWLPIESYQLTIPGPFGPQILEDLDGTRRATRDALLKAINEFVLSTAPWNWANMYIPEFQIKKYKL